MSDAVCLKHVEKGDYAYEEAIKTCLLYTSERPEFREVSPGHFAACHLI